MLVVKGGGEQTERSDHWQVSEHSKVAKDIQRWYTVYKLKPALYLSYSNPSIPPSLCVHVRTQQAGSSPRAQMLSVNTEIPERKQGFTAASCTHSQARQRPGARRGQPAPHKHRPPCLLSEPLVLLPGSGWVWFRAS